MNYIYLSPHLDDAVLSCGGLIWEQVHHGDEVEIWSVFTADPPGGSLPPFAASLHERWKATDNPSLVRRKEDQRALSLLGCQWVHMNYPDCIYRRDPLTHEPIININEDLFSFDHHNEQSLIESIILDIQERITETRGGIIAPLGIGNHVDHRITRLAAEKTIRDLLYYVEFPYAQRNPEQLEQVATEKLIPIPYQISNMGITAWVNAITCYESQISSFWSSVDEMKSVLTDYAKQPQTCALWKKSC